MDIIRKYVKKFISESAKNEDQRKFYLVPTYEGTIQEQGYATVEIKGVKGSVPIKVTQDIGTVFNAIVVNILSDALDEEAAANNIEDGIEYLTIPLKSFSALDNMFDPVDTRTYEEIGQFLQSDGSKLTQEKLDLLEEIFTDYQGTGSFEGVTQITKTPANLDDPNAEKLTEEEGLEKLKAELEKVYPDGAIEITKREPKFQGDSSYMLTIEVNNSTWVWTYEPIYKRYWNTEHGMHYWSPDAEGVIKYMEK